MSVKIGGLDIAGFNVGSQSVSAAYIGTQRIYPISELLGTAPTINAVEGQKITISPLQWFTLPDNTPVLGPNTIDPNNWNTFTKWEESGGILSTIPAADGTTATQNPPGGYITGDLILFEARLLNYVSGEVTPQLRDPSQNFGSYAENGPVSGVRQVSGTPTGLRLRSDDYIGSITDISTRVMQASITSVASADGAVTTDGGTIVFTPTPGVSGEAAITFTAVGIDGTVFEPTTFIVTVAAHSPVTYYVAPSGDDATGDGSIGSPFRQPQVAADIALVGDTVELAAGTYEPFEVKSSGAENEPITFRSASGEERQAIIEGDLLTHAALGGPGAVPLSQSTAHGVRVGAQSYIHIMNLTIQNVPYDGVHFEGDQRAENIALDNPVRHGGHVISGCRVRNVGSVGIWVSGYSPNDVLRPGLILTDGVLIENNDVSEACVPTDYNQTNAQGIPGGVNEVITVVAGVANVITRNNDIHDSRQYGIDYKHGVYGGEIHGNRVWNIERYGIYLDTNRRTVENIDIYDNTVWNCRLGVVLSREADYDPDADADGSDMQQTLRNIRVFNNTFYDCRTSGIFCQRHGGDSPHGEITNVRIFDNVSSNCSTDGVGNEARLTGWGDSDFVAAGIVSGFEFTNNRLTRAHNLSPQPVVVESFSGKSGFNVSGNVITDGLSEVVAPALSTSTASTPVTISPFNTPELTPFRLGQNRVKYNQGNDGFPTDTEADENGGWSFIGTGWVKSNFANLHSFSENINNVVTINVNEVDYLSGSEFILGFELEHVQVGGARVELGGPTGTQAVGMPSGDGAYENFFVLESNMDRIQVRSSNSGFIGTIRNIRVMPIASRISGVTVDGGAGTVTTDGETIIFTPAGAFVGEAVITYDITDGTDTVQLTTAVTVSA